MQDERRPVSSPRFFLFFKIKFFLKNGVYFRWIERPPPSTAPILLGFFFYFFLFLLFFLFYFLIRIKMGWKGPLYLFNWRVEAHGLRSEPRFSLVEMPSPTPPPTKLNKFFSSFFFFYFLIFFFFYFLWNCVGDVGFCGAFFDDFWNF